MREWLVIEDSAEVFRDGQQVPQTIVGFIPRDIAEAMLGKRPWQHRVVQS